MSVSLGYCWNITSSKRNPVAVETVGADRGLFSPTLHPGHFEYEIPVHGHSALGRALPVGGALLMVFVFEPVMAYFKKPRSPVQRPPLPPSAV